MRIQDLESFFSRAWSRSFSKKKLLFSFLVLMLCGLFVVLARAMAFGAGKWVLISLTFLPFFLSTGIILALGIILSKIYHDEVKQKEISYRGIFMKSWDLIICSSYLSVLLLLTYIFFWVVLGFFFLLKEIPGIGDFIGILMSFAPFLLILASICLCLINIVLIFYITPAIALNQHSGLKILKATLNRFKEQVFSNILLFVIAAFPVLFMLGLLILAASLTGSSYPVSHTPLTIGLQWFFMMVPFIAPLTPLIIFFFNFSVEAHVFFQKKVDESIS